MSKPSLALAAGALALGAYVLWKRVFRAPQKYRFEAPLPPHIGLPDAPVQSSAKVELSEEYSSKKMRHLVVSSAISPSYLTALLPVIKELFVPQKVCAVRLVPPALTPNQLL